MNGFRNFLRIGGSQDEHHMRRRLFQRLQKRIESRRRKHVNLVDDVYLVAPARRRELHAPDYLLAHVVHARAACRVKLVYVGVRTRSDHLAVFAGAVRLGSGSALAQKRFRQKTRRGGFARAARPAEQIGMAYFILLDGVFYRTFNMLLANNVFEYLRPVFSVKRLRHRLHPPPYRIPARQAAHAHSPL